MTKTLRLMLLGIAFLVLGTWGAALNPYGNFFGIVSMFAPVAGVICIILSFLETDK